MQTILNIFASGRYLSDGQSVVTPVPSRADPQFTDIRVNDR